MTSRRDELTSLRDDLQDRMKRKRQERQAAKLAWEAIQRVELCKTAEAAYEIVSETAHALGCDLVRFTCDRGERSIWPIRLRDPLADTSRLCAVCRGLQRSFDSPLARDGGSR